MNEHKRERLIRRIERWLLRKDFPRIQMVFILSVTGATGFIFSFLLLKAGLAQMWIRYPVSALLSYVVFLFLLRLWIQYQGTVKPEMSEDDASEAAENIMDSISDAIDIKIPLRTDASSGLDSDEIVFLVILLVALCAGVLVCSYVVFTAPNLFAELILDAFIMNRIYRRVNCSYDAGWLATALRRTWIPALLLAACLSLAGFCMQEIAPKASSIGPFIEELAEKI